MTLACGLLHYQAKPYRDHLSNRLEYISLTLHSALAYLLAVFPDPASHFGARLGVFLLLPLPAILFLVYVTVVTLRNAIYPGPLAQDSGHKLFSR